MPMDEKDVGGGRMKYWSELSIEEKIERTREVLKGVTQDVQEIHRRIYKLEEMFANHDHKGDKVVSFVGRALSIEGYGISKMTTPTNPNEVYF